MALVSGGGSGIGRAVAAGLARDGARVIAVGRSADTLAETARSHPGLIRPVTCDVSSPQQVERLFADIADHEGRVDFLVNSHGIYPQAPLCEFDLATWARTIDINLTGCANLMRHALPGMLARDFGRIIVLGSRSARAGGAVTSAYSASKAGVEALVRSVAHELLWKRRTRPNVQANVLIPGETVTGLIAVSEQSAAGHQRPDDVYPYLRSLLATSRYAGSGRIIFRSKVVHRGDIKLRIKQLRANLRTVSGI